MVLWFSYIQLHFFYQYYLLPLLSTSVKSTAKQGLCHILESYMNENFRGEWGVYVCHVLPFLSLQLDGQLQFFPRTIVFLSFFLLSLPASLPPRSLYPKVIDFYTTIHILLRSSVLFHVRVPFLSFMPQSLQNDVLSVYVLCSVLRYP